MTLRVKVNHGGNGANLSFFRPVRARKALRVPDERQRSEEFYRRRAELHRQIREAQAIARGRA